MVEFLKYKFKQIEEFLSMRNVSENVVKITFLSTKSLNRLINQSI